MGSVWKKVRQLTEDKMLWLSRIHTKCLPSGGDISFSQVSFISHVTFVQLVTIMRYYCILKLLCLSSCKYPDPYM